LALVDAIGKTKKIKFVFSHHEQAAVMEAQGYCRVSGKIGVALVTTGGGTVNSLSGILSAYLDSIPVFILSGNESSFHCENMQDFRAYGVQGFDSKTVADPITKSASRILSSNEITSKFVSAWDSACTDRKGPVLVDFPMDLQRKLTSSAEQIMISDADKKQTAKSQSAINSKLIAECSKRLSKASRPLLYFGNGIRDESALCNARELIEKYQIPFCLSWSALDLFENIKFDCFMCSEDWFTESFSLPEKFESFLLNSYSLFLFRFNCLANSEYTRFIFFSGAPLSLLFFVKHKKYMTLILFS
jgi:acetolactate synthase-1/2/3 large subunit